jgi:hypothetical protein
LTDTNGRIREEYNVSEVFTPEATNSTIFNMMFPSYLRALVQGVNISLFEYGSTGSGKTHTMNGNIQDSGLT